VCVLYLSCTSVCVCVHERDRQRERKKVIVCVCDIHFKSMLLTLSWGGCSTVKKEKFEGRERERK